MTLRLFPGVEILPTEVQVALLSLVFNRGVLLGYDPDWSKAKELDRRWEIRRLQGDVRGPRFVCHLYPSWDDEKALGEVGSARAALSSS
jgi:hypothetical protein